MIAPKELNAGRKVVIEATSDIEKQAGNKKRSRVGIMSHTEATRVRRNVWGEKTGLKNKRETNLTLDSRAVLPVASVCGLPKYCGVRLVASACGLPRFHENYFALQLQINFHWYKKRLYKNKVISGIHTHFV